MTNYRKIQQFYQEHGHLGISAFDEEGRRLSAWLHRQRRRSVGLSSEQRLLLESIGCYNKQTIKTKKEYDWEIKYSTIKKIYDESGVVRPKRGALASWLSRERKKMGEGNYPKQQKEKLQAVGIVGNVGGGGGDMVVPD